MCNQLAMIRNKIKKHDKVYIKRRQILYYIRRCDKKTNVYIVYSIIDSLKVKTTLSDKLIFLFIVLFCFVFF